MRILLGTLNELPVGVHLKIAQYRYKVFVELLGWKLQIKDGVELDQFDRPDTVYVAAQSDDGEIVGCARLLPTISPYLLGDVFPYLLNGLKPPCSHEVWELSRFAAVNLNNADSSQGQLSSPIRVELLDEAVAYVLAQGGKRLICISPIGIESLIRRAGFHTQHAGLPMNIDGDLVFACWIDIT